MLNEYLKDLRLRRNLEKEELAKILKISISQIEVLENGKFYKIPDFVLKNIIDKYEKFFKLKEGELSSLIEIKYENEKGLLAEDKKINLSILHILILGLIFYIIYQIFQLVLPPKIEIYYPKDRSLFMQKEILIKGFVDPRTSFYINGEATFFKENGYFEKMVILKRGINKFIFEAKNYLGIKNKKELNIYYQEF